MATTVSLSQEALAVEPGNEVTTELRVRNTGDVVDQFNFQPLGDAAPWIEVEPPSVRLFPNTDETVTITIAPPRSPESKPGQSAWAVKAIPSEDPAGAAVAEGTVDVAEFSVIEAELQPSAGRGRLVGRYEIAVDNRGNIPMQVRLTGTDAEQALGYEFADDIVATEPGAAHFTKLKLRPGEKIWRGQPKSHSFQILVEPQARAGTPATAPQTDAPDATAGSGDATDTGAAVAVAEAPPIESTILTGTLLQEPILPKWLLKAVLALLALLLLLFILWKTLLQPQVESAARAVAVEEVEEVQADVTELEEEVEDVAADAEVAEEAAAEAEEAAAGAEEAAAAAEEAAGGGGGGGGGGGLANVFNETSAPSHDRLTVVAGPGELGRSGAGALPDNETFALTDVILQNPGGAVGRIRIELGGETILESALENFRDLDFHFVSPYIVSGGQELAIEIDCAADQVVAGTPCDAAVSFAGFTTTTESS